jgi:hypothetical protein
METDSTLSIIDAQLNPGIATLTSQFFKIGQKFSLIKKINSR